MDVGQLVLSLLEIVVKAAPGFLSIFSGKATDEEALTHARGSIATIRSRPAGSAFDEHVARAEREDEPTRQVKP